VGENGRSWAQVGEKTTLWALFGEDEQGLGGILAAVSDLGTPTMQLSSIRPRNSLGS
jgi:hypothetical protein